MSTLQDFQCQTSGQVASIVAKHDQNQRLRDELSRCVPVYGYIQTACGDEYGETGFWRTLLYFADENGTVCEFESDTDTIDFTHQSAIERVAPLLGVTPDKIKATSNRVQERQREKRIGHYVGTDSKFADEYGVSWDYGVDETDYWWNFLYVDQDVFNGLRQQRHISVVADNCSYEYDPAWRMVAPQPVRVKDAPFDFDLGSVEIRFIAGHKDSIEYVTKDGVHVYDNRKKPRGTAFYNDGRSEPIIPRHDALEKFIRKISHGPSDSWRWDEQQRKEHDFKTGALATLVRSPHHLRHSGRLISQGIEVLTGSPYFKAEEVFSHLDLGTLLDGTAISNKTYVKRMLLKDAEWEHLDAYCMNPRYVVVNE